MSNFTVEFEPLGQRGKCREGESLLDCARRLGIEISSICAGRGTCGTCRIQLTGGKLSEPTANELKVYSPREINEGWRLACQARPLGDCRVMIPPESMSTSQRIQLEGNEVPVAPEPPVRGYDVRLDKPSLSDQRADADRLLKALKKQHGVTCRDIDISVLRDIPGKLRKLDWGCRASVRGGELVAVGKPSSRQLGLAVDLGTTTIAVYLIDLETGRTLATEGVMNPQIGYGEDIISRINYAVKSRRDAVRLQKLVINELNELAAGLCSGSGARRDEIVEAVVVGNTAMHHLLLGLPSKHMALTPFVAAVDTPLDIRARDLGLRFAAGAYVHFPPVIAGFIGADHTAALLAGDSSGAKGPVIVLDIGTNTEVSLLNGDRITATSCASGPAFEGGHISNGMRAGKGAIEKLRIRGDVIDYQTIENAPPTGICGSGVLDAMAQLYLAGAIDEGGRFTGKHSRIRTDNDRTRFVIADRGEGDDDEAIVITQKDIRELQLAKAAIRTGIQLLLEANGLEDEQVERVVIAGAFGSYIDLSSAVTTGLLPALPPERFRQVGNAAGMGAKLALISLAERRRAISLASGVKYLELAGTPEFRRTFVETSALGRYRIDDGKRKAIE